MSTARLWFAPLDQAGGLDGRELTDWLNRDPDGKALAAWSEGLCPLHLAPLQYGESRHCPKCRGFWHVHREPAGRAVPEASKIPH